MLLQKDAKINCSVYPDHHSTDKSSTDKSSTDNDKRRIIFKFTKRHFEKDDSIRRMLERKVILCSAESFKTVGWESPMWHSIRWSVSEFHMRGKRRSSLLLFFRTFLTLSNHFKYFVVFIRCCNSAKSNFMLLVSDS